MTPLWIERANCRDADPRIFFPPTRSAADAQPAKNVCAVCPVKRECLSDAVRYGDEHGIRGGLTEEERREVATSWRKRICEWCANEFMWEKTKYVTPPAFCGADCRRAQHLHKRAEAYQRRAVEKSA